MPKPAQKASLQSLRIQRFKRIEDASIDLGDVNVFVGGNNAGKSSLIQGLHFGVGLLQTIALFDLWKETTLNPNQLIYSPAEEIHALGFGGRLVQDEKKAIQIEFVLRTGESCSISVRKGKNKNISVSISNTLVAARLSSLESPFSVFSPGLAGIAKHEPYVSDGVLLRTLARGDANLILRNLLLRLHAQPALWSAFLEDLGAIFPKVAIDVSFDNKTGEFIGVSIQPESELVPLELAGTGVLQAVQILSYIHLFSPSMIVLDEPDSHLHPNNQRLLCSLLRRVADERSTQILLTTHSRHVVDALMGSARFLWVRKGSVDVAEADDEVGILLDIGALDVKERAGQASTRAVVLTEDANTRPLELVLWSSGFDPSSTVVLPYFGVTGVQQLRPLVNVIKGTNPTAKIVLHRDRDFLSIKESEAWKEQIRALGVEPFVTKGRDIESYFLNEEYLSEFNPEANPKAMKAVLGEVLSDNVDNLTEDYVNGRMDILRKTGSGSAINPGSLAVEAQREIKADPRRYAGKTILKAVRAAFQKSYGANLQGGTAVSELLSDSTLAVIASKLPKKKPASA